MKPCFRTLMVLTVVILTSLQVFSQTTGKKKFPDPKKAEEEKKEAEAKKEGSKQEDQTSKFGWGVNLGNLAFAGSAFEFGLSPNVAYKLDEAFAVGFMLKLNYYYEKYGPPVNLKFSAFDFGPTVFARWKPLMKMENATPFMQGAFLQADYERAYIARPAYDSAGNILLNDNGKSIKSVRNGEDYLYLGVGFASGYPFSTFFSFHFNVIDQLDSSRTPFDYRLGFTYNY